VLVLACIGTLACIGGAGIETALSGAYNVCQFFDWPWGKNLPPKSATIYTTSWVSTFILAFVLVVSGIRPLQLVNFSIIIFGMAIMPLTYYPILRVASDKKLMGKHVNTTFDTVIGVFLLVVIVIAAAASFPLMILTHSGQP
jgi:manganese transport protein